MIEPIPIYGEEAYAILYNKFGTESFSSSYLKWFLTEPMTKKIFYLLGKRGWILRVSRGLYKCKSPEEIIKGIVQLKIPTLLETSGKKYCYTNMSAVEIWSDFTYMQRGWEHSPYYIKVLQTDVKFWISYFKNHSIPVFVKTVKPTLGEFVVLVPIKKFVCDSFKGKPVDSIKETVEFCKKNIDMFEYPLAYFIKNFRVGTKEDVDPRVMEEVKS